MNLTINHNIHLNREQRYALYNGTTIEVIGISLPVWLDDGYTSEPAKEIFCRYVLHNTKEEKATQILNDGYEITLPYRLPKSTAKLSDKSWLKLSMNNAIQSYYDKHMAEVSGRNLLDPVDGGGKCLMFREQNQLTYGNRTMNIIHYIQISDMEDLVGDLSQGKPCGFVP